MTPQFWLFSVLPVVLIGIGLYLFLFKVPAFPAKPVFKKVLGAVLILCGILLPSLLPQVKVQWMPYSADARQRAAAQGIPVVLDFYADWCVPCHQMERFTYTNPEVILGLQDFVRLKIDATDPESMPAREVIAAFEVEGLPTVIFLDEDGIEIPEARLFGFVSAGDILKVLNLPQFRETTAA